MDSLNDSFQTWEFEEKEILKFVKCNFERITKF
jgi:phage pi2 protein 07